jgi:hypothetical protein
MGLLRPSHKIANNGKATILGSIKALIFILAAYLVSARLWAEDTCPAGPFETDVRVISAAISSHPLRPRVWDARRNNGTRYGGITDGASWDSAGGLMNYGSVQLTYDAKRYVVIHVLGQWPARGARLTSEFGRQLSNQVIRRAGNAIYTTTITRPTPEQARQFGCLANRLSKHTASFPAAPTPSPDVPAANTPTDGKSETCSSTAAYTIEGYDDHEENFALVSGGSVVEYDPDLSCAREAMIGRIIALANDWVTEAIARAGGTWRGP